jgi:hypothetical protein
MTISMGSSSRMTTTAATTTASDDNDDGSDRRFSSSSSAVRDHTLIGKVTNKYECKKGKEIEKRKEGGGSKRASE